MAEPPVPVALRRFFVLGEVVADTERNVLLRHGELVKLEPRVMALLAYLAANEGRVVGKDELIAHVWNGHHVVDEAVQRAVSMLRAALGDDAKHPHLIETVPTRGYRLMVRPRPLEAPVAPVSAGFAGSRVLILVITALLAGLVIGGALMNRGARESVAPPAPTPSPTPQAREPQPAPPAPVG
jgi:DNA-binding winged helix-turn-helix (wHTH) protein